jgi:hypothetical protein
VAPDYPDALHYGGVLAHVRQRSERPSGPRPGYQPKKSPDAGGGTDCFAMGTNRE